MLKIVYHRNANHFKQSLNSQMIAFGTTIILLCCAVNCQGAKIDKDWPIFLEPVKNVTVALGRDVSLSCSVDNLASHKVAWVHLDREIIIAIHRQIVSREQRFSVTHDSHKTWTLHVNKVEERDRGLYMCQVNTIPMMSQQGFLQVVVPPNIADGTSSGSSIIARERDSVILKCKATGFPKPKIRWRREDSQPILVDKNKQRTPEVEGGELRMSSVTREHMGSYLCIASNGVPPSVSKRITLDIVFAPEIYVPNQLVGVPVHSEVQLECQIESSPKPVTYWSHDGIMISNSSRVITEVLNEGYRYSMILLVKDVRNEDFGQYTCTAKNSFAEVNGSIKLNKLPLPTRPSVVNFEEIYYPDHNAKQYNQHRSNKKSSSSDPSSSDGINIAGNLGREGSTLNSYNDKRYNQHNSDQRKHNDQDSDSERLNRNLNIQQPADRFAFSSSGSIPEQGRYNNCQVVCLLLLFSIRWITL